MKELNGLADEIVEQLVDCVAADLEPVEQYKKWTRKRIAEAFRALEQRTEAAEAALAELQKQEPVGWMTDVEVDELHSGVAEEAYIYAHADATSTIPLFTRPAPAINLAELLPDEMPTSHIYHGGNGAFNAGKEAGWNACRAAILRKIEEQSQ
ncbi:hypothetical protein PSNIH1_00690 [Pantoea sp. PSNIH1]|nr:hypothetical protein PSNIH1_00690 [Pantoea sp. PSNIH1]